MTTANLVAGISRYGVDLHLVDTADRRGLKNVGRLDAGNVLAALVSGLRFATMLVRLRPDVVYVPIAQNRLGFLRDALFLLPARLTDAAVVVHLHGCALQDFYRGTDALTRWVVRTALAKVACAVVLGPSAIQQFDGLVPRSRVRVVANGVADIPLPASSDRLKRLSRGEATVLYLGALTMGKGFTALMSAVPLLQDMPGLRFIFAGEFTSPEAEREARRLLDEPGMRDRVLFTGPVSEPEAQRLLSDAAALVLPARQVEGQPLVILEAFRAGTPVIATPSGCIVDTVRDGEDGILVPQGDPAAIAGALRRLTSNIPCWQRMSAGARSAFDRHYRLDSWLASLAGLFRAAGTGLLRRTPCSCAGSD